MRTTILAFLAVALFATSVFCQQSIDSARTVRVLDDRLVAHALGEYLHGTTLLHLWGSWCSECMEAFPAYNRLVQSLADDSLNVVNVAIEMNGVKHWKRVIRRVGTGLQLYVDGRTNEDSVGYLHVGWIQSFPAYLLIDSNGYVIEAWYTLPTRDQVQSAFRRATRSG